MTKKKAKLKPIRDEKSRAICMKRRKIGLVKKVRELTILCDVKACLIVYSPNEAVPMVWPSPEGARELLHNFYALSVYERRRKETNLEQYMKDKTKKVHDQLMKSQKNNTKLKADQLMAQLHHGREISNLNSSEINDMQSFTHAKLKVLRKKLGIQHPPLPEPVMLPMPQTEATANAVFVGGQSGERFGRVDEAVMKRINIGDLRENQTRYLLDGWVYDSREPPNQGMEWASYNQNPGSYLPYQGSSSNGTSNLELISQPLQYNNNNALMVMNQPRHVPFGFVTGGNEGGINNNIVGINTVADNVGLHQEPPPNQNETAAGETNADARSFGIDMVWPHFNNFHF